MVEVSSDFFLVKLSVKGMGTDGSTKINLGSERFCIACNVVLRGAWQHVLDNTNAEALAKLVAF